MDLSLRNCLDNTSFLQKSFKTQLKHLEEEFNAKNDQLKAQYSTKKKNIEDAYNTIIAKSNEIEQSV